MRWRRMQVSSAIPVSPVKFQWGGIFAAIGNNDNTSVRGGPKCTRQNVLFARAPGRDCGRISDRVAETVWSWDRASIVGERVSGSTRKNRISRNLVLRFISLEPA